jgi:hypothetical protein
MIFWIWTFTQINCIKKILWYAGDVARIIKTQIIKTFQEYFIKTKNEWKLCIVAYIANATLLIGGTTIPFSIELICWQHNNKQIKLSNRHLAQYFEFIIVDEISMVNYNVFVIMHLKLQNLMFKILPFNGINIMFLKISYNFHPSPTRHYINKYPTNLCIYKTD